MPTRMLRWTVRAAAAPLALVAATVSALSTRTIWFWMLLSGGFGVVNRIGSPPIPEHMALAFPVTLTVFLLFTFKTARARWMVAMRASSSAARLPRRRPSLRPACHLPPAGSRVRTLTSFRGVVAASLGGRALVPQGATYRNRRSDLSLHTETVGRTSAYIQKPSVAPPPTQRAHRASSCAVRASSCAVRAAPCAVRAAPSAVRAAPSAVGASSCAVRASSCAVPAASCVVRASPCAVRASPCAVRASPCAVRASPCAVRASPCAVRASPCAVRASPCAVRASPCTLRASPCAPRASPCAVRASPCAVRASPCAVRASPRAVRASPRAG
jgi:hypothetical protein